MHIDPYEEEDEDDEGTGKYDKSDGHYYGYDNEETDEIGGQPQPLLTIQDRDEINL